MCWTGDRVIPGLNPAVATSLRNFGNSVYPALPVSFEGDTKSRRSLLPGVYARPRGSIRYHQSLRMSLHCHGTGDWKCVTCRGLHHSSSSSFSVQGSVFSRIDALLGEFRLGCGVHGSYTFQCGLVGYFTSPGIDTRIPIY